MPIDYNERNFRYSYLKRIDWKDDVAKNVGFLDDFVTDINHCAERGILVKIADVDIPTKDHIKISLLSGKFTHSDKDFWLHDNKRFNILLDKAPEHFEDESLFKL